MTRSLFKATCAPSFITCPFSFHFLSVGLTSSSPHSVVLLGFLLFPGRHVCPDHVGDAAHPGRLCAEVQGPRALPRLVSLHILYCTVKLCCNWQHLTWRHLLLISVPMRCRHCNAVHYNSFLHRPVLKRLPVICLLSWCNLRHLCISCPHVYGLALH